MESNLISLRAKNLYELLTLARKADQSLRDLINDDIDSSEEFDNHVLSGNSQQTYKVVRTIEKLLADELQFDVDGQFRSELEKLFLIDSLKYGKSELKRLLSKRKSIKN